tara:strand:+ start:464 stop:988 length:525 start_codon:yes stop_codon:yes gene_type:complete
VIKNILRQYLEIKSEEDINQISKPKESYSVNLVEPNDFQLNKFLYKQIGKKYKWVDRLVWTDQNWIDYVSNKNLFTFVLKHNEDFAGYFELILHNEKKEAEIAYFGILEDYFGMKLGGYLLSEALKKSFSFYKVKRVWCHTCSLDHKNALKNYLSRGMRVFKSEHLKNYSFNSS